MPIMRISRGTLKAGSWDDYEKAYRIAVERVGRIPGQLARTLVRDAAYPDKGYAISVWETQDVVDSYVNSELAKTIRPLLEPYFTGDYAFDICDIRFWEGNGPAAM